MHFKEIEFKFDATDITLVDFINTVEQLNPEKNIIVSSYDDYFTNEDDNFIRYRHNESSHELTIKRKTNNYNNNERVEINLDIIPQAFGNIEGFVSLLGYKHNFRIYKICHIFWIKKAIICYYIVYDENMTELNRFIEIEANEKLNFVSENEAFSEIRYYEDKLKDLGIYHKKRLKRSLFEMYYK